MLFVVSVVGGAPPPPEFHTQLTNSGFINLLFNFSAVAHVHV